MTTPRFIEGEPPPRGGGYNAGKGKWQTVARQLKTRPGVWAVVWEGKPPYKSTTTIAARLRNIGCEVQRRTLDGTTRVYARWPEGGRSE